MLRAIKLTLPALASYVRTASAMAVSFWQGGGESEHMATRLKATRIPNLFILYYLRVCSHSPSSACPPQNHRKAFGAARLYSTALPFRNEHMSYKKASVGALFFFLAPIERIGVLLLSLGMSCVT